MTESVDNLVVLVSHGPDEEMSSVAFTIATGGLTSGLNVAVFLVSSGVDVVRRRAAELTHVQPLEPLQSLVDDFVARGGELWACTPCVKARGYEQADLLEGVTITGASPVHERIKQGAATLSF